MPTARRSRTIAAPVEQLWELVRDPHHLPRWWPRVTRVEGVEAGAFTEVMRTKKGKVVRADFDVVHVDEAARLLTWAQRIDGTPFARVLSAAETDLQLTPVAPAAAQAFATAGQPIADGVDGAATEVTIELRQTLARASPLKGALGSFAPRLGGGMVRRAAEHTVEEALAGLERICG